MFTGIVNHCGKLLEIQQHNHQAKLWIETQFNDFELGESIAIDGMCVTVNEIADNRFACELSPESMRLSIAQQYQVGQQINLERALRLQDRLGGHFVSGHVDETLKVVSIKKHQEFTEIVFTNINDENKNLLIKKGSVSINGVSLTINEVNEDSFTVMLIPHTLARTNLLSLNTGQIVNVEYDQVVKVIVNQGLVKKVMKS